MKMLTSTLKVAAILIATLFVGQNSFAAALCPINSCNYANGCIDGCPKFKASGIASCSNIDYLTAVQLSKNNASEQASVVCNKDMAVQTSVWFLEEHNQSGQCSVTSSAEFMCLENF